VGLTNNMYAENTKNLENFHEK